MRFRRPGKGQAELFAQVEHARQLATHPGALDKLKAVVDFELFRNRLMERLGYVAREDKGGNAPFDPVFMFKILVLQKYHALSEEATELAIKDRFSFMRFLSVSPGDPLPDKNTIWDFKEALGHEGIGALFDDLDSLLTERGIYGKAGVMVDASFIEVPRQRNRREENEQIKEGQTPPPWKGQSHKLRQKDVEARWSRKNEQTFYGYKNHIKADVKTKLIMDYRASAANLHDSQCFEEMLKPEDGMVYADSAYRSKASMAMLRRCKIKARICQKGRAGQALRAGQKRANRAKSRVRAWVEHVFASTKQMGGDFIRTIGAARAIREIGLGNFIYNLLRLVQLEVKLV
jgi:IS5 family transposase